MDKQAEIKIFSFHYQPGQAIVEDSPYINVWAGRNHSLIESNLVGDDIGDNISDKNKYYSELTGIYWAWKNNSTDIWGTCHYRRFFTVFPEPVNYKIRRICYYLIGIGRKRHGLIYTSNYNYWKNKIIDNNDILKLFSDYDAIMPVRRKFKYSIGKHYSRYHNIDDLKLLREILNDNSPELIGSFDSMLKQKRLYANNMFILKNDQFEKLMNWLFGILFEFEKRINLSDYQGYQERIFGFLSERLITCWFIQQNLRVKELNLIYFKKLKRI
jgi:hypothetical protein